MLILFLGFGFNVFSVFFIRFFNVVISVVIWFLLLLFGSWFLLFKISVWFKLVVWLILLIKKLVIIGDLILFSRELIFF